MLILKIVNWKCSAKSNTVFDAESGWLCTSSVTDVLVATDAAVKVGSSLLRSMPVFSLFLHCEHLQLILPSLAYYTLQARSVSLSQSSGTVSHCHSFKIAAVPKPFEGFQTVLKAWLACASWYTSLVPIKWLVSFLSFRTVVVEFLIDRERVFTLCCTSRRW